MADIDLIPKEYALRRRLGRRLRWAGVALLLLIGAVGAARAALWLAVANEQQEIAGLRKTEHDTAETRAKIQAYAEQKAAAEAKLKALDGLRGRDRVQLLLQALDSAYMTGVWFDEVRSYRVAASASTARDTAPGLARSGLIVLPREGASAPAQGRMGSADEQRVELTGHAIDHSRVAAFITKLSTQPGIADVQLLDTSSRVYTVATVIDFKVALVVDRGQKP